MTDRLMRDAKHSAYSWAEQLKRQMKKAGITQVQLAKRLEFQYGS
ncbi:hypothetical protein [Secundilactobacillus yichangensis]|nr:hypothetical protein [Secundilactobacillus yichangensis]